MEIHIRVMWASTWERQSHCGVEIVVTVSLVLEPLPQCQLHPSQTEHLACDGSAAVSSACGRLRRPLCNQGFYLDLRLGVFVLASPKALESTLLSPFRTAAPTWCTPLVASLDPLAHSPAKPSSRLVPVIAIF